MHAKVAESNRGQKWLEATRTRHRREVVFSPELAPRLHELVAAAKADAEGGGKGLLFPATQLGWISRHNFAKRVWRPAVTSVPGWRSEWSFHTLRHCAAIAMIEDLGWPITGQPVARPSRRLGDRTPLPERSGRLRRYRRRVAGLASRLRTADRNHAALWREPDFHRWRRTG